MADVNSSPLFKLPGELRNLIYRLSTVREGERISVDSAVFPEPALLSTSKKIREEASAIFYGENRFTIYLPDWECTPFKLVMKKAPVFKALGRIPMPLDIFSIGRPSWCNFEEFLYQRYIAEPGLLACRMSEDEPPMEPMLEQVMAMMTVVQSVRDLPWERVQPLLVALRRTLVACDSRWADGDVV